jgi:hypothetical protein
MPTSRSAISCKEGDGRRMLRDLQGQTEPADTVGFAIIVSEIATGEMPGSLGKVSGELRSGTVSAKVHAEKLTSEERCNVAKKAAAARGK